MLITPVEYCYEEIRFVIKCGSKSSLSGGAQDRSVLFSANVLT